MKHLHPVQLLALLCLVACAATDSVSIEAQRYGDFGDYQRVITTDSAIAQEWFDQGMQLLYGFNHDEAIRSFHAAAASDPDAAMPWWGIAYAQGININDPAMTDERSQAAREAADNALARIGNATAEEAALIRAVSARYEYPAPKDRVPLDEAYVAAMQANLATFPEDSDVGALFADSLMNLQPWSYWTSAGEPVGRIDEIVSTLETIMAREPDHPGANHFYIHAVEASGDPDRAEAAADRLLQLVPASGHLVHMPSHIYVRVGRYADAMDSNREAVAVDRAYFERAPEPAMYAIYFAHNLHFLAYASMMSGNYEDALKAARSLEREMPEEALRSFAGMMDGIMPTTFHVLIRFGKWEAILEEPAYPEFRYMSNAVRTYARSIANSALGRTEAARAEMTQFEVAVGAVPEDWFVFNNSVGTVLPIARAMILGELLYREGKYEEAFATLREGVATEDTLVYDEPPGWMLPVRHALGALLMEQGQYAEAEVVYREDLVRNRNNGWGLLGLQKSLLAQGKSSEAEALTDELTVAWSRADTQPVSSCFCAPGE